MSTSENPVAERARRLLADFHQKTAAYIDHEAPLEDPAPDWATWALDLAAALADVCSALSDC